LINALERQITLGLIDESWKNHLRQMDEMKQSVQLASYEQKDPLLIYKFEAFNLFKEMIGVTNKNIVSFLIGVASQCKKSKIFIKPVLKKRT
jgi:preprotein translocase subunit SecA